MKFQDVTISNYLAESPYTQFVATLCITRIPPVCNRPVLHTTWAAAQQVLGCWLPTSQARIQSRGRPYEICAAQSEKFSHFSPANYHFTNRSHSSIIQGWYNTPLEVTRNLLLSTTANKTTSRCYLEWHPGLWTRRFNVKGERTRETENGGERRSKRGEIKSYRKNNKYGRRVIKETKNGKIRNEEDNKQRRTENVGLTVQLPVVYR